MEGIAQTLQLSKGDCVALIGSGGKTSLLHLLSKTAPMDKILLSTTTKIEMPPSSVYDYFVHAEHLLQTPPRIGRTLTAMRNDMGKMRSVDESILQKAQLNYSLTLLESDGSRQLPLKAWAEYEPVVPSFTTLTIGVIPLWPLGKPASEQLIHRFSLFSELTGLQNGQTIEPHHLIKAITSEHGKSMFSAAQGRKILFFSQVESKDDRNQAKKMASLLPSHFCKGLHDIVAGSAKEDLAFSLFPPLLCST